MRVVVDFGSILYLIQANVGLMARYTAPKSEKILELAEEQIRQAVTVVPCDYWKLICWMCRDERNSTFTCPFLNPFEIMYFTYRYYPFQIAAKSSIPIYLEDLLEWRLDPKNDMPRSLHNQ